MTGCALQNQRKDPQMSTSNSISTLFDTFLDLRGLRPGTVAIYRYAARRLIASVGDADPVQVAPLAAMRFAKSLTDDGLAAAAGIKKALNSQAGGQPRNVQSFSTYVPHFFGHPCSVRGS